MEQIVSRVYAWNDMEMEQKETRERRAFFKGGTTHLEYFEVHSSTVEPRKKPHDSHVHDDAEELVIIREGTLEVTIEGKSQILGPGSIALIMPGDEHGFSNPGDIPASYYILKYRSRSPMNADRGKEAGGSFVIDWDDLAFVERKKGGVRRYFDRATTMCGNFEMHVTDLKAGLQSHDVHTHKGEEIILLLEGNVEEQIKDSRQKATVGDVIFLGSMVPHTIKNIGNKTSRYFAFKWE